MKQSVNPIVKTALLLHCVVIFLWCMPKAPQRFRNLVRNDATPRERANAPQPNPIDWVLIQNDRVVRTNPVVQNYLLRLGLWQYWDMFAPNPASNDFWVDARADFADGTSAFLPYPRMSQLSIPERYIRERYRKFMERGHLEDYQFIWPYIARKLARDAAVRNGKDPVRVHLVRHFRLLPGPDKPMPPYNEYEFFRYDVKPEDLN